MLWAAVSLVAIMWGMPFGAAAVGATSQQIFPIIIVLAMMGFLLFNWMAFLIRCPQCGRSVFTAQWGPVIAGRPWPSKKCSKCGERPTALR